MKRPHLLAGLVLVCATAFGLTQERGRQQDDPLPPATTDSQSRDKGAKTAATEAGIADIVATKIDVDVASLSLMELLERVRAVVIKADPALADRFEIRLSGNDLKAEGITRNQRVRNLKLTQKSLGDVLTEIVRRANPDQTAREPSDARQKLVWAISPEAPGAKKYVVWVTTRQGAEAQGRRLPAVFRAGGKPDNARRSATKRVAWSEIVSVETLEDEIKTIATALPGELTTSSKFARGGRKACGVHFGESAVLFGVISQYDQPVRWQAEAAPLARSFSRIVGNSKVDSKSAYDAARLSRDRLVDLVRGSAIHLPDKVQGPVVDLGALAHRVPLMQRMDRGLRDLRSTHLEDQQSLVANQEAVVRESELIALFSTVIRQPGLDEADDEDYAGHARKLTSAAKRMGDAARLNDLAGTRAALQRVKQTCTKCHEEYR